TKVKATYGGRKTPERYRVITKTEENNNKHTTNSLESRVKYKDTNSVDWHIRGKHMVLKNAHHPLTRPTQLRRRCLYRNSAWDVQENYKIGLLPRKTPMPIVL
ncbi:hypothetical protein DOY81_013276, partial [Sarcophaga bullata]